MDWKKQLILQLKCKVALVRCYWNSLDVFFLRFVRLQFVLFNEFTWHLRCNVIKSSLYIFYTQWRIFRPCLFCVCGFFVAKFLWMNFDFFQDLSSFIETDLQVNSSTNTKRDLHATKNWNKRKNTDFQEHKFSRERTGKKNESNFSPMCLQIAN